MENKYIMTLSDNIEFAKREIVDSIYKEAQVEGINVTFPETQQVYDGTAISTLSYDDMTKIRNLKRAWSFILDTIEYPCDIRYLRHMNFLIQNNISHDAGIIRSFDVKISGTKWHPGIPTYEAIENDLNRILAIGNPTERALMLMLSIMRGQYFADGNKRTAQLIANHELISNGAGIISVPVEEKTEFANLLIDYYERNDTSRIFPFLYDYCIHGYERTNRIAESDTMKQHEEDESAILGYVSRRHQ